MVALCPTAMGHPGALRALAHLRFIDRMRYEFKRVATGRNTSDLAFYGQIGRGGFDHPALDSLVLAMPVSWKGTLQQYVGRLQREHAEIASLKIIDFVDTGHPALLPMWAKRRGGYRAMGIQNKRNADLTDRWFTSA